MSLQKHLFLLVTTLSLIGAIAAPDSAFAQTHAKTSKKHRKVASFEGKITHLKNGRDQKKKRYWEYSLRTKSGKTVLVHDYQYGRYRQPAAMGLSEGAKRKVRGFFVHISPTLGTTQKVPVLIVSPAN